MTARALLLAGALVALAVLFSALAGCGGGDDADDTTAPETAAATTAQPPTGRATVQPVVCNAAGVCR